MEGSMFEPAPCGACRQMVTLHASRRFLINVSDGQPHDCQGDQIARRPTGYDDGRCPGCSAANGEPCTPSCPVSTELDSRPKTLDVMAAIRSGDRTALHAVGAFDPIVYRSIAVAEQAEQDRWTRGFDYECPGCHATGHAWAGALFVHLITCSQFRKGKTDEDQIDASPV